MLSRRSLVLVALLIVGGVLLLLIPSRNRTAAIPQTAEPVERGCDLEPDVLTRIWRGHRSGRSEDITAVPKAPNYLGSFAVTSHSGPWDYLQRVPLVLYGPGRVQKLGPVADQEATLADVYPTVGTWTGVDLPARYGESLTDAVAVQSRAPKLLVFVVWDGVGRNVLNRWPDRWPNLARLEEEGTSYVEATVGSSPSITPATHATLGTGAFPRHHGITGIQFRERHRIRVAQAERDPEDIRLTTFADEFDRRLGNEPKVGLVALRAWHIPMMGHGSQTKGGDKDQLAIIGFDQQIRGNNEYFETPSYVNDFPGLQRHIDLLDLRDGNKDGDWRENEIATHHDNPAWAGYQTDVVLQMLKREGYGEDEVTDLFFTNYKMTDIVGHQFSMDSERMGDMLEAQDRALGRLVNYLDDNVRDYAIVITADHGHTPPPGRSNAWPIAQDELENDMNRRFDVPEGQTLKQAITAVGPFIDEAVLMEAGGTLDEVARFMNSYTISDNWPGDDLPEGYEDRGGELVFEAAFPSEQLDEVVGCKFDAPVPPGEIP